LPEERIEYRDLKTGTMQAMTFGGHAALVLEYALACLELQKALGESTFRPGPVSWRTLIIHGPEQQTISSILRPERREAAR
jgi:hypothetical protein